MINAVHFKSEEQIFALVAAPGPKNYTQGMLAFLKIVRKSDGNKSIVPFILFSHSYQAGALVFNSLGVQSDNRQLNAVNRRCLHAKLCSAGGIHATNSKL